MWRSEGNEAVLYVTSAILAGGRVQYPEVSSSASHMYEETYNIASKPPACVTCSGRISSSQSNASGSGISLG